MQDVNSRTDLLSDFIPYAEPPKYGLIDMTGTVVVTPTWDEARILSPDWVWIRVGSKVGLADKTGHIHITPAWDSLDILTVRSGSLAEDGKTVLVGDNGTRILSPWVRVRAGDKTSILRTDGTPAIPDTLVGADYIDFYGPDHVAIRQVDAQGGVLLSLYEPATGTQVKFPTADKLLWNWNESAYGVIWMQEKVSGLWHLMGRNGQDLGHTQPAIEIPTGWGFVEKRARLHKPDGWIFIGPDGKPISAEKWEQVSEFKEGRAAVSRGGKWGFIELNGSLLTEVIYEEVRDFNQGLAVVKQDGLWGFIGLDGKLACEIVYEEVRDPSRRLAAVKEGGLWGYIDLEGQIQIVPVWDEAGDFFQWFGEPGPGDAPGSEPFLDIAEVKIKGAAALIGRDGALIVDPRTPELAKAGAAYVNGNEELIVMRKGADLAIVKRDWAESGNLKASSRRNATAPLEVSPARGWKISDEALTAAAKAESENRWGDSWALINEADWILRDETGGVLSDSNWSLPWYDSKPDPFGQSLLPARTHEGKYGLL